MKKLIFFAALLLTTAFTACEKEEVGGTATQSVAGQWYVTIDAVDDNGTPIHVPQYDEDGNLTKYNDGEDYFDVGRTLMLTYNTAGNASDEMWIDNMGVGNFAADYASYYKTYGFFPTYTIKAKVKINQNALTFSSTEAENFGEGYEWWTKVTKKDSLWNDVLDEDGNKIMVDSMFHAEYAMPVTIEGKILPMAGTQNNGSKADSIVFFVTYKNDPWYPGDGYAKYKVSGIRYSGLAEND